MVNLYVLLTVLTLIKNGELKPFVKFEGTQMLHENETVLTFHCSTTTMFLGCSVEFLVNSRTYDDIRSINNTCHHKDGVCQPDRCACSVECNEIAWNSTVQPDSINNTFGCDSRIVENGNTYKAETSLKWNGNDFIIVSQSADLINVGMSTIMPEPDSSHKVVLMILLLIGCLSAILCVFISYLIRKFCHRKDYPTIRFTKTVKETYLKNDYGDSIKSTTSQSSAKISILSGSTQVSNTSNDTLMTSNPSAAIPI